MTKTEREPVTIIGLGPMGSALARAFLRRGHRTTVWNRTPSKAAPLVADGAAQAGGVAEAVTAGQLVIVCVLDYAAADAVLAPVAAELAGRTLINLTADTPERARTAAAWAAEHGIDYLDGAIMTPDTTIGRPEAVLLLSGSPELYQTWRPTLTALGGTITHVGTDPGRAAAYDVALLDMFWTAMTGLAHGFALARAEQVPATELAPFAQGIVELAAQIASELARDADAGAYPGDGSTLASNVTSMTHIIHAARDRGIDTGVMDATKAVADRAIADGHGEDGFARLIEVFDTFGAHRIPATADPAPREQKA